MDSRAMTTGPTRVHRPNHRTHKRLHFYDDGTQHRPHSPDPQIYQRPTPAVVTMRPTRGRPIMTTGLTIDPTAPGPPQTLSPDRRTPPLSSLPQALPQPQHHHRAHTPFQHAVHAVPCQGQLLSGSFQTGKGKWVPSGGPSFAKEPRDQGQGERAGLWDHGLLSCGELKRGSADARLSLCGCFPEHLQVSPNPLWDQAGTGNRYLQPTRYQTLPLPWTPRIREWEKSLALLTLEFHGRCQLHGGYQLGQMWNSGTQRLSEALETH